MNIRSIDLGYGFVKYTCKNPLNNEPAVVTRQIPALALPVRKIVIPDGAGMKQPQTVAVNVKEVLYQVGPDTPMLLAGVSGRDLNSEYSRSDRYEALMLGTLAYMNEKVIDVLVLGLPVSKFKSERERLSALFKGKIKVPMFSEEDRTQTVEVKNVLMLPQPMGGFLDAMVASEQEHWRGDTLVIDPGFYTFDWIVVSENYTYISSRSGAAHGGVASVLRMVADELEEEFGKTIADLFPIDRALKSGEPMRFYGKSISLDKYKPLIDAKCESYVSDMVARLGDTGELSRVVLCGGGARLFGDAVKRAFPSWEVHICREPIFANVRGFQIAGDDYAAELATVAA